MIDPTGIANGALAGVVGNAAKDVIDEATEERGASTETLLKESNVLLRSILEQLSLDDKPDIIEYLTIQADPAMLFITAYEVHTYRRNHMLLHNSTANVVIMYKCPGLPAIAKTLVTTGYYQLDLPPGTLITCQTAMSTFIKWSDYPCGIAI